MSDVTVPENPKPGDAEEVEESTEEEAGGGDAEEQADGDDAGEDAPA